MEVLVAGGHGQIALRLLKLLSEHGHHGRGLIRNPGHAADLEAVGAEAVLSDLETDDPHQHVGSAQAIVFAAGAGPGSGAERKRTVDLGGAVKLIDAARDLGVARYVMVSAMGTQDVEHAAEAMRPYLQAKKDADDALMASGLDWTIVRPGRLTDAPGAGTVDAARALGRRGEITRDDTALVLLETLVRPSLARVAFDVLEGPHAGGGRARRSVAPANIGENKEMREPPGRRSLRFRPIASSSNRLYGKRRPPTLHIGSAVTRTGRKPSPPDGELG